MKTLNREEGILEWQKFWDEMKNEWFKVEVLQDYSVEDMGDSLQAWFAGNRKKSLELMKKDAGSNEWVKMSNATPAKKIRIHIVDKPYSPYLLWEIEYYKLVNIPLAGEEIYLVQREAVKDLDIPDGDFMIFDNKQVVRNYYTSEGKCNKADFYYEDDDIRKFLDLKTEISKVKMLKL